MTSFSLRIRISIDLVVSNYRRNASATAWSYVLLEKVGLNLYWRIGAEISTVSSQRVFLEHSLSFIIRQIFRTYFL